VRLEQQVCTGWLCYQPCLVSVGSYLARGSQIYELEGVYLEETSSTGNVLVGFENYLKKRGDGSGTGHRSGYKRKFKEEERLFSRSSVTMPGSTWVHDQQAARGRNAKAAQELQRQKSGQRQSRSATGAIKHKGSRKSSEYVYSSDSDYEGY
jgi:hypothetical protein